MLGKKTEEITKNYQIPKEKYVLISEFDKNKSWKEIFETKTEIKKDHKGNRYGTLRFTEMFFYEGETVDGKMEGKGLLYKKKEGLIYVGSFKNNHMFGKGERFWSNGDKFTGYFENSLREGEGEVIIKDIGRYKGQFKLDNKHGLGAMYFDDKGIYEGFWDKDKPNNFGLFRALDKSNFAGEWLENQRNGFGVYENKEGIFIGYWINNKLNGNAIIFFSNSSYEGEMINNVRHGFGRFENENIIYEGYFVEGKFEGHGKLFQKKIHINYVGSFKENYPHGQGALESHTGLKLKGNFKYGSVCGVSNIYENDEMIINLKFIRGRLNFFECFDEKHKYLENELENIFPVLKTQKK